MAKADRLRTRHEELKRKAAEEQKAALHRMADDFEIKVGHLVAQSSTITGKAVQDAERTDAIVRALAAGAEEIATVASLIFDITSQTNLLAVSATIEAARAGDAGKGCAVAASEVEGLANQTCRVTEEMSSQISQIRSAANEAVLAIRGIATTSEFARNVQWTSVHRFSIRLGSCATLSLGAK